MILSATLRRTGSICSAHAALPDFLEQLVGAYPRAGLFSNGLIDGLRQTTGRLIHETGCCFVRCNQLLNPLPKGRIVPASLIEKPLAFGGISFQRGGENRLLVHGSTNLRCLMLHPMRRADTNRAFFLVKTHGMPGDD
jgi:hypothetical protein